MKHRYSSKARLTNHGHGSAVQGPVGVINLITKRKLEVPDFNPETHAICPECRRVVMFRADGTLRGHRSQGVIPCIGASARVNGADYR